MPETSCQRRAAAEAASLTDCRGCPLPAYMVAVDQLTAHPGNVREDLDLTAEFWRRSRRPGCGCRCWSPRMTTAVSWSSRGTAGWLPRCEAGLAEVPCVLDPGPGR